MMIYICVTLVVLVSFSFFQVAANSNSCSLKYTNWDNEKTCSPLEFVRPHSADDVSDIVRAAMKRREKVKVLGGGLSFSGVQLVDDNAGVLLSLDKMNNILSVDHDTGLVEVQAGIMIRDLCVELADKYKLALPQLGATASQSIVGATQTGTHGTGTSLGAIAQSIMALRLVDAQGKIHVASVDENKPLFDAARVGVGAVGIITSVTLQTVPLFKLKRTSLPYSLDKLLLDLPVLLKQYDRLQWSWTPYTDNATVVIREEVPFDSPLEPAGPDGGCWSETQSTTTCTDLSYKVLTDSYVHYAKRSLYTEMEMFVPVEDSIDAVRDFISYMDGIHDHHDDSVVVSAMVRYVAADDIMLSPCTGRDTAVLSIIVLGDHATSGNQEEFRMFASGLQAICESTYSARPHWGKVNYVPSEGGEHGSYADYLRSMYPRWDEFRGVLAATDPTGIFTNEYLRARGIVAKNVATAGAANV